jgi:hypothetical protein
VKPPIDNRAVTNLLIAAFVAIALVLSAALLSVRTADAQETINLLERSVELEQELRFEALRLFLWGAANEVGQLDHYYAVTNNIMSHEKTWTDAADMMAMYFVNVQWAVYAVDQWADVYGVPEVSNLAVDVTAAAKVYANSGI